MNLPIGLTWNVQFLNFVLPSPPFGGLAAIEDQIWEYCLTAIHGSYPNEEVRAKFRDPVECLRLLDLRVECSMA